MLNNPGVPAGYRLMQQAEVTREMTAWAVALLHDPAQYPMHAVATSVFNCHQILARIEWHPPDFLNESVHRGVTLYELVDEGSHPGDDQPAEGVDLSHYQQAIRWDRLVQAGISFAFIKASEGAGLIDASFAKYWDRAKDAGLLRGAYHFFRPHADPEDQARVFLAQLDDPGELPPVLDVEVTDGVSGPVIISKVNAWLDAIAGKLRRPLIYTSPAFWRALPEARTIASKADLWVADWGTAAPIPVHGWADWAFWQYTNKSHLSGLAAAGNIDGNRFRASAAELSAYAAKRAA